MVHTTERVKMVPIGTYPLVEGGEELDVRLEVFSCLLEGFVV